MSENKSSRVVIIDEDTRTTYIKSEAQIIKENEQLKILLSHGRPEMTDPTKEAIRNQDFEKFLEQKKAQRESSGTEQPKPKTVERRVSLRFGVIGSGQAGGKLAKVFYDLGYDVCAVNTAKQDLELLEIPEGRKFFMNYSLGGTGKDLEVARAAIEDNFEHVKTFITEHIAEADVLVLCASAGGGTGAGSASTIASLLATFGKPVIVMLVLPGSTDDSQSKFNAVQVLSEMADMASKEVINSLVLVDNAKIELAYSNLGPAQFWKVANNAIVEPLHMFNALASQPSNLESLDPMDLAKSLLEAGNCVLFGSNRISRDEYESNDLALVSAISDNLEHGLLASGFDLKEAQSVGILVTARQEVLDRVPTQSISFIFKFIADEYSSARVFKGIYQVPSDNDDIQIYFIFSGMGLPRERVDSLKKEADRHMSALVDKKKMSADKMNVGLNKDRTTTAADKMLDKIRKNKSAVGKLISASRKDILDRRR
jgi:cell division GTPase FtsZ